MKNTHITYLIEITIIVIAASSFFLSYTNLYSFALSIGIPPLHCPLFPICIDFFLIACSLYILYAGENKLDEREGWAFLITFTIVSIVFNVQQSIADGFWGIVGHATPPISLCISLHIGMKILKHELFGTAKDLSIPIENFAIDEPSPEIDIAIIAPPVKNELHSKIEKYLDENPGAITSHMAKEIGVSYNTVKKYRVLIEESKKNTCNRDAPTCNRDIDICTG